MSGSTRPTRMAPMSPHESSRRWNHDGDTNGRRVVDRPGVRCRVRRPIDVVTTGICLSRSRWRPTGTCPRFRPPSGLPVDGGTTRTSGSFGQAATTNGPLLFLAVVRPTPRVLAVVGGRRRQGRHTGGRLYLDKRRFGQAAVRTYPPYATSTPKMDGSITDNRPMISSYASNNVDGPTMHVPGRERRNNDTREAQHVASEIRQRRRTGGRVKVSRRREHHSAHVRHGAQGGPHVQRGPYAVRHPSPVVVGLGRGRVQRGRPVFQRVAADGDRDAGSRGSERNRERRFPFPRRKCRPNL